MIYAPKLGPVENSAPYSIGLDVVLSDTSIQDIILGDLEGDDSSIILPAKEEIIEIGRSVSHVGNALSNGWLEAKTMPPSDIAQISNIFDVRDKISAMIAHLLSVTSIDKSENPINNFSEEHEFKILEIDFKNFKKALEDEGFTELYKARIYDIYNDFYDPKLRLDNFKAVNRNRFKVGYIRGEKDNYQRLLTLKRKLRENETEGKIGKIDARKAYELEYLIKQGNFRFHAMFQSAIGLQPYREKVKNRWAYIKEYEKQGVIVKVDIDKYDHIPHLAEFEISRNDQKRFGEDKKDLDLLNKILEDLGVGDNQMVGWGSRKLFEYYQKNYFHFFQ